MSAVFFWSCSKTQEVTPVITHPASTITDISPKSGRPGTTVIITGTDFAPTAADNAVSFNGTTATITSATPTQLVVTAPPNAKGGPISVTAFEKSTTGSAFSYYNIYAFGYHGSTATYWKDETPTYLVRGAIYDLAVSGSDIHAIGYSYKDTVIDGSLHPVMFPTYWKNGVVVPIQGVDMETSFTRLAVSGPDVYVIGVKPNGIVYKVATYWKNGVEVPLTNSKTIANVSDIVISGSDVYISGSENSVAKYWKNGVATSLSEPVIVSEATGIAISGQDVYVSGTAHMDAYVEAKYWKNGVSIDLTELGNNKVNYSTGIAVSGSDVYVCGAEYPGSTGIAKYWKNGTVTALTDGRSDRSALTISVIDENVIVAVFTDVYENGKPVPPFPVTDEFTRLYGATVVTY